MFLFNLKCKFIQNYTFIFFPFVSGKTNIVNNKPHTQTAENIHKQLCNPIFSTRTGKNFEPKNKNNPINPRHNVEPNSRI